MFLRNIVVFFFFIIFFSVVQGLHKTSPNYYNSFISSNILLGNILQIYCV